MLDKRRKVCYSKNRIAVLRPPDCHQWQSEPPCQGDRRVHPGSGPQKEKLMDTIFENFDFMAEPVEEKPPLDKPEDAPTTGKPPALTTNKDLVQSVLNVFDQLGRETWLKTQATLDPKTFLNMLGKLIPKSIDAEDLQGMSIIIVDQYLEGDKVLHIHKDARSHALPASAAHAAGGGPTELGLPASQFETATGGNPKDAIDIIDVFE